MKKGRVHAGLALFLWQKMIVRRLCFERAPCHGKCTKTTSKDDVAEDQLEKVLPQQRSVDAAEQITAALDKLKHRNLHELPGAISCTRSSLRLNQRTVFLALRKKVKP